MQQQQQQQPPPAERLSADEVKRGRPKKRKQGSAVAKPKPPGTLLGHVEDEDGSLYRPGESTGHILCVS